MKISVNLINSYLKNQLSTEKMSELIEQTEVEVEEILYAKKLDDKIIVAKVIEVVKHPNADKLNKAKVDNGASIIDIVCGAPNIKKGLTVALAQVGSVLPDGFEIGEAKIRGEISHGMLCSEKELGWGQDHNGIVELDPSLSIGQSLCDIANISDVIDIKTPSNRWDYLSYIGLSREIAAFDPDNQLISPELEEISYKNREVAKVNKNEHSCKAFYTVKARVKANTQSPGWLVDNLQASGIRTINPVVDITNFVMLEYGQPSHAYDAKKLQGPLGVRLANNNEKLVTLDGKKLDLNVSDLVIVDNSGPIGLAGVMGGISTETDNSTNEVIIEIANFDKTTVRRSALRHGIRTEASARFEKGLPASLPSLAAKRIVKLLKEICNAEILDVNEQLHSPSPVQTLGMRLRKADKFIGYKLDEKEVMSALARRGFEPKHFSFTKEINNINKVEQIDILTLTTELYKKAGIAIGETSKEQYLGGMEIPENALKPGDLLFVNKLKSIETKAIYIGKKGVLVVDGKTINLVPVTKITKSRDYAGARRYVDNFNHIISVDVPWWRDDVRLEADLFEEVAKTQGYNTMPDTLPNVEPMQTSDHQLLPLLAELKDKLVAVGMMEVMTYAFISIEDIKNVYSDQNKHLQIENPLSSEQDYLRNSLLPSHLRAASTNQSSEHQAMFEISRVYEPKKDIAQEKWVLGLTVWGDESLLRLKGLIDQISAWYNLNFEIERMQSSKIFINGRSGIINDGYGHFGQIYPKVLKNYDIKNELSYCELSIENIIKNKVDIKIDDLLPYQIIYRDITVELPSSVLYSKLAKDLENKAYKVSFVDEFVNEDLKNNNRKRITLRIGLDMGPNPKNEEIAQKISELSEILSKNQNSKIL